MENSEVFLFDLMFYLNMVKPKAKLLLFVSDHLRTRHKIRCLFSVQLGSIEPEGNLKNLLVRLQLTLLKTKTIFIIVISHEFETLKLVQCCSFNQNDMSLVYKVCYTMLRNMT